MRVLLLLCTGFIAFAVNADDQTLKPGDTFKDCELCPEMVMLSKPGTFKMGAHPSQRKAQYEYAWHDVTIDYDFAVGKFELLQTEYNACVEAGVCSPLRKPKPEQFDWMPAYSLTWDEANAYVKWLANKTGKAYRLLSQSEWEYAARGGVETVYWWGDEFKLDMAICQKCSSATGRLVGASREEGNVFTYSLKAGHYINAMGGTEIIPPNPLGLYFMLGNVREWVQDCAHVGDQSRPVDGVAWIDGGDCSSRVVAGQAFNDFASGLKTSRWGLIERSNNVRRTTHIGTRVAITID